jgi:ABC-2 type transport system ATP-binding protein
MNPVRRRIHAPARLAGMQQSRSCRVPVLSSRGLTKSFARGLARAANRTLAIDRVDLDVCAGEVVGIAGPEGSGKTTLLQCLAGLLRCDAGTVELFGARRGNGGHPSHVAYVPAVPVFYPFLCVRDVLEFRLSRVRESRVDALPVDRLIHCLDLTADSHCRISTLPAEVVFRVAVAEAMISRPAVLLVDTSVRDLVPRGRILEALREFPGASGAVVVAARNAASLARVASRIVFVDEGRLSGAFHLDDSQPPLESTPARRAALFVAEGVH